jgi:hypothetical protein
MTNHHFMARFDVRDRAIRASDADRERIAERLRRSHAEGRLDTTELQQRVERCYEAKTFGELEDLVTDLPREDEHDGRRSGRRLRPWPLPLMPLLPILIVLIVISAASGHHVFWLWIPLAFFFWRTFWWRRARW